VHISGVILQTAFLARKRHACLYPFSGNVLGTVLRKARDGPRFAWTTKFAAVLFVFVLSSHAINGRKSICINGFGHFDTVDESEGRRRRTLFKRLRVWYTDFVMGSLTGCLRKVHPSRGFARLDRQRHNCAVIIFVSIRINHQALVTLPG
jgi:hypothetical protein